VFGGMMQNMQPDKPREQIVEFHHSSSFVWL
jgi:hypothetical protein